MKSSAPGLSPALVALMSLASGLAVASHYYVQPLLATVAQTFALSFYQAGFIVTTGQPGYAADSLLSASACQTAGWYGACVMGAALTLLNIVNGGLTRYHEAAAG